MTTLARHLTRDSLASDRLPTPMPAAASASQSFFASEWLPPEPKALADAGLEPGDVEALILRLLLTSGPTAGRRVAEQIRLPFGLVTEQLRGLKAQGLIGYSNQAAMGDFENELTVDGRKRAQWYAERCTYCGAVPVPMNDYLASVERQSVSKLKPTLTQLCTAFADLSLAPAMISQVGQAIHAGRGLFLYGHPGNGKTSIAERLSRAIAECIWIPRTITVTGETIRLFDPANHQEAPLTSPQGQLLDVLQYDRRWVRIQRPVIIVGGELRLEQLEIAHNPTTGILEAPLQLKSNCGSLVVDDFGRQPCGADKLLNRWIVPLEKGHDYLNMPSGRQIQVPFDQLLVFSTNLPPKKLIDEAFLRRIPYKIEVSDPSPREFRDLVRHWCGKLGIEYQDEAVEYLLTKHFGDAARPMRYCHPRDLVQQVKAYCQLHDIAPALSAKAFDMAVKNYFAGL